MKKTFAQKLTDGDYMCRLPWPGPETAEGDRTRQIQVYNTECTRLVKEFKADMFEHYGVADHPKAEAAYRIAWDHGHASGYHDINSRFADLVELLK